MAHIQVKSDEAGSKFYGPKQRLMGEVPVSRSWRDASASILRLANETCIWLVWIPLLLLALGNAMNVLAVTMNHGTMPVVMPGWGAIAHRDTMHVAATANSKFLILCDWIQLRATRKVASPGDFLITVASLLKWPLMLVWVGFNWSQSNWRKLQRPLWNT